MRTVIRPPCPGLEEGDFLPGTLDALKPRALTERGLTCQGSTPRCLKSQLGKIAQVLESQTSCRHGCCLQMIARDV